MASLNKNVEKIPYKKEGRAGINENLRFSTLTVTFFSNFRGRTEAMFTNLHTFTVHLSEG